MIYGHFLSEFESLNNDSFVNFEILILGFEKCLRRRFCKFEMQNLKKIEVWKKKLARGARTNNWEGARRHLSKHITDKNRFIILKKPGQNQLWIWHHFFRRVSPHWTIFGSLNLKLHKSTLSKQSWHIEMLILRRRFFLIPFLFSFYSEAWRLTIRSLVWADFEVNWLERLLWKFAPRFNLGFPTQKPIPVSERPHHSQGELGHEHLQAFNVCENLGQIIVHHI